MESPDGLVAKLAKCQLAFPPIVKSHENSHFKSQYADIADVLDAVRPVLAAEGIAVVQPIEVTEMGTVLVTRLMLGDEVIESKFVLPIENLDAQRVGSWVTYMRRFCLCSLLAVHPVGDDDDGNLAALTQSAKYASETTARVFSSTTAPPDDWESRPLASMTFAELRGVAEKLNHPFSGGSKSELIRQLEPLVRAASGEEPFDIDAPISPTASFDSVPPESIPFEPVVAVGAADESGSRRVARNSATRTP